MLQLVFYFSPFYVGIQLFVDGNASDSNEATAFYRENVNPSDVDIFSNSWGPSDNGRTVRGPGRLAREALKLGVERARTIISLNNTLTMALTSRESLIVYA